jgi:hypothetical protein
MKLVDQWRTLEENLPADWQDVRLTLTTERPADLPRAAQTLAPLNVGRVGQELVFHVRRTGGAQGPDAVRRLFARLDESRVWCMLAGRPVAAQGPVSEVAATPARVQLPVAESWDTALAPLPSDFTDLLCELEVTSSDHLDRAALLCAPLNPTRDPSRLVFRFRCSGGAGYGVSPGMARRCFERLDGEHIPGTARVLRALSDLDNVGTQGAVWLVGGKTL